MKIIVLDSTAKSIKAVLASSVATSNPDFVVAYADTSDNTFSELSSDGQLNDTTDVTLVSAPASGVKRAIKSITIYNRDTAAVTVSIKFDNGGTQRILQRVQLVSGETWHSDELTKQLPGGSDTQVQFNDGNTLAGSSNFTYNKTTSVLTLGANPVLTAGTANGVLYLNGSKSATTGSVLTFDGAQLGVNGITIGRGAGAVATNTAVGASALASTTSGGSNTGIGRLALYGTTTGASNTTLGNSSAQSNTTGSNNVAVGDNALFSNTTASNNTAVGYQAGYSNTTGTRLAYVGYRAGFSNTTGNDNTAIGGTNAMYFNTTGSNNVAIGTDALVSNTTASNNTAVGYQAGYSNTTGSSVDAFGFKALFSNTTGTFNVSIGNQSLTANSTGGSNTASGYAALFSNTTASNNSGIGFGALYNNTTGANNTAVGSSALLSNTTASNNTAVGYQALYSNITGATNTAFGHRAGYFVTSSDNTLVGNDAGRTITTGSNNTALGSYVMNNSAGVTGSENVGIGRAVLGALTSGSYNIAVGSQSLGSNTTASNNTAVGYQAGYSNQTSGGAVFIGYQAGYGSVGISTTINYNTAIGYQAGYGLTSGYNNTLIGNGAGGAITSGYKNTIIGAYSGNQGGLDIRTLSNYIVLSDGDGNPRIYNDGNVTFFKSANNAVTSRIGTKYVSSVGTSATTIATALSDYGQIVIVNGNSSGNIFTDLIFTCSTAGPTVLSAKTISGGPAGRTYTMNSGYLQLAMGSGTYDVWCNQYLGT